MSALWHIDRRGTAALEFALIGPTILALLGVMTDLSLSVSAANNLAQATASGAQYAFIVGATVTASTVQTMVQNATTLSGVTTTVTGPARYCTSGSPAALSADPSGVMCADGTMPGIYLTVTASYTYTPLMPAISTMINTKLQQSATVRLQ